ncbi:hypothetical protein INT45_012329 [Circinella minor]|uniref:Uncharacterized protein n=1 Tax=Circinella minor TaxID=1195481 RepID=A0A8H7VD10_9FUNG|nr:hypothetical protein INT45_012329 [Circinella minor]
MAQTKQRSKKRKQPSKEANVKTTPKILNGLPQRKSKSEPAIKLLEEEIQNIISQKNLVVNSKRHLSNDQQEIVYLQRARDLAAEERDRYIRQQGLGKENRRDPGKRWAIRNALQNEPIDQLPEVQNQMQQTMMMDSNNNNNSNHVTTMMPLHHQSPSPLQTTQGNPFLTHLVNNNPNHSSDNMAQSQREMHRFDIPSLSSQSQYTPRIVHHSQMVHTNQPPTIPLQLPPQQALSPSYKQVGMNAENNIEQVNRGGRGGLNSYHYKHQEGQQQQQQHSHVRTTARGTVAGSSSSIHSMMSPQIVTTTIPTPAVAYNDNNGGGGGIGNTKVSGNTRLIDTGNHDNDDEGTEEVFVDALDNIKNQQDSDNGIIGTMKGWVSTTFRRFGNF